MDNKFFPQAIQIVTEAINEDNNKNYQKAFQLYKKSLEHFMIGVKYEKNPTTKELIMKRIEGYMSRAEQLREILEKQAKPQAIAANYHEKDIKSDDEESVNDPDKSKFRSALSSAIISEKPNIKWEDVSGLEAAKEILKETIILPIRFPQLFTGKRKPWKGILLYGPPGTGKSFLAKAVATEADSTFFSISSSNLVSKWQGESEKLVRSLFDLAREQKPSIIFIDEIDSLCSNRSEGESDSTRRIKTEFLVQMQGVGNSHDGILVLGATNVPWELDPAMRRRFEKRIYIPLPDFEARIKMFQLNLGDTANNLNLNELHLLAKKTEGCSGSDISVLVREALMEPLRRCQQARFFTKCNEHSIPDKNGQFLTPSMDDPPCPYCHMKLSSCGTNCAGCLSCCNYCKSYRMRLYDLALRGFSDDKLKPPPISMADFNKVMEHSVTSVAEKELERFVVWTSEFGQEG